MTSNQRSSPCASCVLVVLALLATKAASDQPKTFRAAVFEYESVFPPNTKEPVTRQEALGHIQVNLDAYKTQAEEAKRQGAQILLFPEFGIIGGDLTRETIEPYLEVIPHPEAVTWSACSDPDRFPDTEVVRFLSCLARNNSLYIVAHYGDKAPCSRKEDPECPPDGRYQYSASLAFGPDGTLLAKYHKRNLYYIEVQFDVPEAKVKYFDTPFGRFGLLVCFDLLMKDPTLTMLTSHGIRNVAYVTGWVNLLPYYASVGFMSAVARGFGVNVLAPCLHKPEIGTWGSGLYGKDGPVVSYYNRDSEPVNRLLVGDMEVLGKDLAVAESTCSREEPCPQSTSSASVTEHIAQVNTFVTDQTMEEKSFTVQNQVLTILDGESRYAKVCVKGVCCYLTYEKASSSEDDLYVLSTYDGLGFLNPRIQICSVILCPTLDPASCGAPALEAHTLFRKLKLTADMETPYVLPQVMVASNGSLQLTRPDHWTFTDRRTIEFTPHASDAPLVEATLLGRKYDEDGCSFKCGDEPKRPDSLIWQA